MIEFQYKEIFLKNKNKKIKKSIDELQVLEIAYFILISI